MNWDVKLTSFYTLRRGQGPISIFQFLPPHSASFQNFKHFLFTFDIFNKRMLHQTISRSFDMLLSFVKIFTFT